MRDTDPHFQDRLIKAGWRHLYWKKDVKSFPWQEQDIVTFLTLEALERMNLHFLRKQVLDDVANYVCPDGKSDDMATRVSESLHRYCEAIRDREFIADVAKKVKNEFSNPFVLRSNRILDRRLMKVLESKLDPGLGPDGTVYPDSEPDTYSVDGSGSDRHNLDHEDAEKGFSASIQPVPPDKENLDLTRAHWVMSPVETNAFSNDKLPEKISGKLPGGPWDYRHGMVFINLVQRAQLELLEPLSLLVQQF